MSRKEDVLALAFEVRSIVSDLNSALAETFRPLGLTCTQAEALLALSQIEPVTLKELAENLVAESGHPSRLVSRLVADGLIDRAASAHDGRAVLLSLTDRGRSLARRADDARRPLIETISRRHGADLADAVILLRSLRTSLRPQ